MIDLLTGISKANNFLLKEHSIADALQLCINALGSNISIDRCYIFKNQIDEGILKLYYEYEWCNRDVTPYIGSPELSGYSYDAFPGLYEELIQNNPLYGIVREIQNEFFKEIMEMQGIKAFLFTPIFSNDEFWGWIGFDDCKTERIWKKEEVQALHSVANNIGIRLNQDKARLELLNTLDELDLYIKSSKQAKWEWNLLTNNVTFSYNWFGMIGYTNNELEHSYKTWRDNVHPNDIYEVENKISKYLSGLTDKYEGVLRMLHKNGKYIWIKYSGLAIYDEDKKPIKLLGTHIDISELKAKEQQLEISEEKFRFIAENTTDLICQHDINGFFTYVSSSSKEIIGYEPNELIGLNPYDHIHPDDMIELQKKHERIIKDHKRNTSTFRFLKKDKNYVWLEIVSKLIKDIDNNIVGIQTSSRDITLRINAELEMKMALQKERELSELKSGFVTMASHQFRTPLTVIYSNIELLNYKVSKISNSVKKDITTISNRIINEVDRMTELMNNILIFGKYESGNLKVKIHEVCLTSFFKKILETYFNNEQDQRKVIFKQYGKPRIILSDESLLIHVFNNLISNSLKYSKNKPNPILNLTFYKNHFKVDIIDFGIGIPESENKHIFQSFFRASNTSTIKGSGLGLIIAKQFTELLNGTISMTSEENKGTTITITFPYED